MPIRTIIVEDEFHPRMTLQQKLNENHPEVEVVAACENAENALIEILRLKPGLVFLDIQLPGNNGLWLAGKLHEMACETFQPPGIIFTTAYTDSEYLLNAFRLAAIDYLVKPVVLDSLAQAVERFKERGKLASGAGTLINALEKEKILSFKNFSGIILLKSEDIAYIKADSNYVELFLANGDTEYVFERLGEVGKRLPDDIFIRVGKSHIVNKKYIRRIDMKKSQVQLHTLSVSYNLEISEKGLKELKDRINY